MPNKIMTQTELILLNLSEIRRRSIKLWKALPEEYYHWQPDNEAMTAIQMIRHVLEADYGWNIIINQGDMTHYRTPWENRPYRNVNEELEFAQPYREQFLDSIKKFSAEELSENQIIHPGNGEKKILGDYLLRIGYHEAVHAGNFLSYLRAMGVDRPNVWD
ncbi:DinB family protein [Flavobacterium sp. NRK F10]|uniref:DinB family protein n=1 Tax=Flavobacterium sp. NRK F10 TaxID=2954931 RepID=UPI002090F629|nr:DinB family protein [Flavobacterium sp. NRK F10]MCO6175964.1 DinB family protein [Flavobacterium sp. NRK F10]